MPLRFNAPLPANPRMENFFERAFFSGVLKNYRAKCLAIQVAIGQKNVEPKLCAQRLLNLLKTDKLPGDGVGVEKLRTGKNVPQTLAESAFACGNSTGDSDCWHVLIRTQQ